MRDIKFRAWAKNRFHKNGKMFTKIDAGSLCADAFLNRYFANGYEEESFDSIEFMQYTGLKDKNGVEIYEGDIVKAQIHPNMRTHEWLDTHSAVFWIEIESMISLILRESLRDDAVTWSGDLINWHRDLEVIGNIYENPELLED